MYSAATSYGSVEKCELLVMAKADVNTFDRGKSTPLLEAVQGGHLHAISVLMEAGADPNIVNTYGESALTVPPLVKELTRKNQCKDIIRKHQDRKVCEICFVLHIVFAGACCVECSTACGPRI